MILIRRESASHWYLRDGTPFHETERADGKGLRSVTLRDARKVRAYPSVTNVLSILAKPGLDAWKIEQGILDLLTHVGDDALGKGVETFLRGPRQRERRENALLDFPRIEAGLGEDAEDVGNARVSANFARIAERDRAQTFAVSTLGFVEWSAVAQIPV